MSDCGMRSPRWVSAFGPSSNNKWWWPMWTAATSWRIQSSYRLVWLRGRWPPGAQSGFIKWTGWTLTMACHDDRTMNIILQSNMSVHHYRCIALCFVNIRQKGRFWAASLASGSYMPNEDRSLQTFQIQVQHGLPGCLHIIRRLRKENSIGISQLIHSSDMSKQRESAELDKGGKWSLSHSTCCIIPDEVMPANI